MFSGLAVMSMVVLFCNYCGMNSTAGPYYMGEYDCCLKM